jgi:hypothetical protein
MWRATGHRVCAKKTATEREMKMGKQNELTYTARELEMMGRLENLKVEELEKFHQRMLQDLEQTMQQLLAAPTDPFSPLSTLHDTILKKLYQWHAFFTTKTSAYMRGETPESAYGQTLTRILGEIEWRIEDMKKRQAAFITRAQSAMSEAAPAQAAPAQAATEEKKPEDMTDWEFQWHLQQKRNESQARINQRQRDAFWKSRGVKWD